MCAVLGLAFLTGCATPPAADMDAPMTLAQDEAYLLRAGDTVKISVYGEDSLNGEYMINPRGIINLPMVGQMTAAGLPEDTLREKIKSAFVAKGYMGNPIVSVGLSSSRPFFIMGQVKNPGTYPTMPDLNIFKAISMAGGYTPRAAENKILIDRKDGNTTLHMNATHNTPILPGDSITVRERIF